MWIKIFASTVNLAKNEWWENRMTMDYNNNRFTDTPKGIIDGIKAYALRIR